MKESKKWNQERRQLIKLLGGGVTFLSIAGLAACSDNKSESLAPAQAAKPEPKPEPVKPQAEPMANEVAEQVAEPANEPAAEPAAEPQTSSGAPQLAESNPQAQALGYRNDSSTVDAAKWPKHSVEQACGNCILFVGKPGEEWGNCGIFPGNQVNVNGWCSAYNKKA